MIVALTVAQWAALVIAALTVANLVIVVIWVAICEVAHRVHAERRAKGIELQPTPSRSRLGVQTRRPPRGTHRRRP